MKRSNGGNGRHTVISVGYTHASRRVFVFSTTTRPNRGETPDEKVSFHATPNSHVWLACVCGAGVGSTASHVVDLRLLYYAASIEA